MSNRKTAELTLHVNLKPTTALPSKALTAFWRKVLDVDFRSAIGRPKTDHVSSGSTGESHVLYTFGTIQIALYSRGDATIEDEEFVPGHSAMIQRIVNAILQTIAQAANKRVYMQVDAYLEAVLLRKAIGQFLLRNVRFSPTTRFIKLFAPAKIVSFMLKISNNLSIAFVAPNHLDFIYLDRISMGTNRKAFVSKLVGTGMKHLKSLDRRV